MYPPPINETGEHSFHPWIFLLACGLLAFWNRKLVRRYLRDPIGHSNLGSSLMKHQSYDNYSSKVPLFKIWKTESQAPIFTAVGAVSPNGLRRRDVHNTNPQANDIWTAAASGDLGQVQQFLEEGVDVHSLSTYRGTPLLVAAMSKGADMVTLLLKNGANPKSQYKWL